jgi:hypothetical protein
MSVRLGSSEESTVVGLHGLIYVDRESGQIVRVLAEGDHFPNDFPVQKTRSVLDYGFVDVGERQFLLPLRADIRMTVPRSLETRNLVEFHDYQKFSSDATITFDRQ